METNTHKNKIDKICTDLKKLFKGSIHPSTVWELCEGEKKHWIDKTASAYGHKGTNQYTSHSESTQNQAQKLATDSDLSPQDQCLFIPNFVYTY